MREIPNPSGQQGQNSPVGPSLTIQEFIKKHRMSRSLFSRLQAQGRGPRMMKLGRKHLISAQAERQWLADREMPSDTEARLIRREQEALSRAGRKASKASFAKGNHISQRRKAAKSHKAKG